MVGSLVPVTLVVSDDEPCYWLSELHLPRPDSRGVHRYQVVWVVRADRLAEYREDLGPASSFPGIEQFNLVGGVTDDTGRLYIEHTVGELRDMALRKRARLWQGPDMEPSDLIAGYHEHMEQKRLWGRQRSVFGRYQRTERSHAD